MKKKENIILQVRGRNPPEVLMSIELFLVLLSPSWSYKMSIAADSPLSPLEILANLAAPA